MRGAKRGGAVQTPGTPDKTRKTVTRQLATKEPASQQLPPEKNPPDESPLDYMLRVMRDPSQEPARRDAMAKACAPFVHGRLGTGDHPGSEPADALDISVHEACRRILFTITQAKRDGGGGGSSAAALCLTELHRTEPNRTAAPAAFSYMET